jgi:hypothetical protein
MEDFACLSRLLGSARPSQQRPARSVSYRSQLAARSSHELGLAHDEKGVSCPIYIARKPDSAQQSMSHVLSNPFPSDPGGNAEDLRDTPDGGGWSSSSSGSTNLAN